MANKTRVASEVHVNMEEGIESDAGYNPWIELKL